MASFYLLSVLLTSRLILCTTSPSVRPNIMLIIADDMGWNDVSFHGSNQILTPNIDLLGYTGVVLDRYYSHCVCTPSRAALLTGKFAYTTGMQGYPLTNGEDRGLPLSEKILPQYLKELGYATHLVGKWHVGASRTAYLPTSRGFDTFFGHRGGYVDYYEYTAEEIWNIGQVSGMDLFRNSSAAWNVEGYITDVYTNEAKSIIKAHDAERPLFLMVGHNAPHSANDGALLQAPPETVRAMRHVESPERRVYAAMMKKLDDSIGDVIEALSEKNILDNTIIVFIGDNGGMTSGLSLNYASNWPLRGLKFTPFEGGVRLAGVLWTSALYDRNHLWKGKMHAVDWLPTLLKAIGAEPPNNIHGIDLWNNIITNKESRREEMFEIDDYFGFYSIISGNYKLVTGNVKREFSNHQGGDLKGTIGSGPSYIKAIQDCKMYIALNKIGKPFQMESIELRNRTLIECGEVDELENICYPGNGKSCLFNIKEDPCERRDLSKMYSDLVEGMSARLQEEIKKIMPRPNPLYRDPRALPSLHNYTWSVWADNISTE